jgi:hypothetical protein
MSLQERTYKHAIVSKRERERERERERTRVGLYTERNVDQCVETRI